ncbi:MAG: ATPase, T2SS/T4P/T4SS family, partial [Alphaproteobacteria bacterium]|nr:ATPase, T2SS/T4P/T4SS family [Alphaproteobacteria bacterium]
MGGVSDALAWLGLKERAPQVDASGLVVWDRMDEEFRTVCAVWADGRCLIAEGYGADAHVREVLGALRATGAVPARLRERIVPLERIAEAWGRGKGGGLLELADPRTVERVHDVFAKAVEAEGDDLAIEVGTEDTRVKVCVHDRKLQIGKPLSVRDGELMIEHLMYGRDEGSGQTGTIRQSFQGFSLGAGEVKLPERIVALRCERGPHAPGGQHLFARMFLSDRVDEGQTVQDLGFGDDVAEIFREIRMSQYGGVFLGGSTGDGKTTSIATNLNLQMAEHDYELNLVTVEDPVEIRIRGAIQIAVATSGFARPPCRWWRQATTAGRMRAPSRRGPGSGSASPRRAASWARPGSGRTSRRSARPRAGIPGRTRLSSTRSSTGR